MHHGGLSALSGESIHVTGLYTDTGDLFLGPAADALHIRSQQGVHTGDTDHDNSGTSALLLKTAAEFRDGPGNFFQMAARDKIRLIHGEVEKTVLIAGHAADGRGISAAAAGGDDQHDGARDSQAGALDTVSLRTRRVEGQRRGRAVDQMACGYQLPGNVTAPPGGKFRSSVIDRFFCSHV